MSRWFRVDDGMVDDPKMQRLPDRLFRAAINLWCVTSQNGGNLPSVGDIAFKLRLTDAKADKLLAELRAADLIEEDEKGLRPHNWNARQFKTDVTDPTNAARQKRFRDRDKTVTPTVTETVTVTDTRADTEQNTSEQKTDSRAVAVATRPSVDPFDEFWKVYPKRDGANPKQPTRKKFVAAVKSGVDPRAIIAAAQRSADEARTKGQIGTPYVPQAMTWLGQQRWGDYTEPAAPAGGGAAPPDPSMPSDDELRARYEAKLPNPTPRTPSLFREGEGSNSEEFPLHHPPGRA